MRNILIADDHAIVRVGTTLVIKELIFDAVIEEAEDVDQALKLLAEHTFELLILDINIPGGNSIQMIDVVKLRQPNIRILVFSAYDEQVFALRYLKAGADGYLMKNVPEHELRSAVRSILNGETYVSAAIRQQLVNEATGKTSRKALEENPFQVLSKRELEVMQLLIKGLSLSEIGAALGIQTPTVGTYKSRVLEKLNVKNVIELAEKAKAYSM